MTTRHRSAQTMLRVAVPAIALLLTACASPLAKALTPTEALAAYQQKTEQLRSAKFDMSGNMNMTLSPALLSALSRNNPAAAASLSHLSFNLGGSGAVQYPNRMTMHMSMTVEGTSVSVDEVLYDGTIYVKNPLSGAWTNAASLGQLNSQANQIDALSATKLVGTYKSVTNLGDTKLGGVDVYHYRIVPDKAKLASALTSSPANQSSQARTIFKDMLDRGSFSIEAWIGKADYLPRKLTFDEDFTVDLSRALALFGSAGSAAGLPAGDVHFTMHIEMAFHDFNTQVSITPPPV